MSVCRCWTKLGASAVKVQVKVIPNASSTEFCSSHLEDALRIRVNAPPDKGKANSELVKFMARHFGVSKSDVQILRGESSRSKEVRLAMSSERFETVLSVMLE
eukprot:m.175532 g.175532  ORF g.175532 m.175532 type:complete len:103 (-) comp14614_c0_seq2:68-376(-)